MSWTTVIWSTAAGACLALGVGHLLVWCWDRSLWANLWFAGVTASVAAMAGLEWAIMRAETPERFCALHHWGHITFFFTFVFIVGFVQSYMHTGRRWLIGALIGLRAIILGLMLANVQHRRAMKTLHAAWPGLPRSTAGLIAGVVMVLGILALAGALV